MYCVLCIVYDRHRDHDHECVLCIVHCVLCVTFRMVMLVYCVVFGRHHDHYCGLYIVYCALRATVIMIMIVYCVFCIVHYVLCSVYCV